MAKPRYPGIRVSLETRNSLAVVAAIRHALRQAGASAEEIDHFSRQALSTEGRDERLRVCLEWADVETGQSGSDGGGEGGSTRTPSS
jgi:hypothetical protein